ncbi:MAG TPA: efflux RND transporter periplasmic adaptor subunit [Syntrophobacteraceae bacterium]|nr:efflux RND transporter periplasmic adaptor subunit [Syntrophobacteraceae bacterium]
MKRSGFQESGKMIRSLRISAVGWVLLLFVLSGCSKDAAGNPKGEDPRKKTAIPVTVAEAEQKNVPIQLRAIGNVQAYNTVTIRAQITGELLAVHFKEGQEVKKGDLLFTIDPRPFEARLKQAEALLAKERAQLANARKQVERYGSVVKRGYVPEEQFDQISANAAALEAAVRADEAAVEMARLELKYCYIRSPINGTMGEVKVHQGNLIKANDNDNPMVTIRQVSPIYVSFSIPERDLPAVKKYMATGKLGVTSLVPGLESDPVQGELDFVDNTVDPKTGTIQLKAVYENRDKKLWPGQFVHVVLTLATQYDAVVLPSQAVQTGQGGQYVFVVKPDFTVDYRPVTAGRILDRDIVIEKGIAPGEMAVTDGHLRLAPGSKVSLVENNGKKTQESRS